MSQTSVSHNQEPSGASPAATGPAGPLFEGQVGAYYLLSMLAGGSRKACPVQPSPGLRQAAELLR